MDALPEAAGRGLGRLLGPIGAIVGSFLFPDPAGPEYEGLGGAVIDRGVQVQGNFPKTADRAQILYRADPAGNVTNYQVYDTNDQPVMRVDVTGASHGGIPTAHVQEFIQNTNPQTGVTYVNPGPVRPATPLEVPPKP